MGMDLAAARQAQPGGIKLQQRIDATTGVSTCARAGVAQGIDRGRGVRTTGLALKRAGEEQIELDPGFLKPVLELRRDGGNSGDRRSRGRR